MFVSYAHADEADVFRQIRKLQDAGLNVWYDTTGIGPGSEWNEEIARAIKGADRFVYFVTPSSTASEHCRRELNFAQAEQRNIVVIHLKETSLPDGLRLSLDNRQAIYKHRLSDAEYENALATALRLKAPAPASNTQQPAARTPVFLVAGFLALALAYFVWWSTRPGESESSPQSTSTMSIAVLPFSNLSNDAEQAFFSDGIAEDILNELAKNAELTVRPRSSSFSLRAEKLDLPGGVSGVLRQPWLCRSAAHLSAGSGRHRRDADQTPAILTSWASRQLNQTAARCL